MAARRSSVQLTGTVTGGDVEISGSTIDVSGVTLDSGKSVIVGTWNANVNAIVGVHSVWVGGGNCTNHVAITAESGAVITATEQTGYVNNVVLNGTAFAIGEPHVFSVTENASFMAYVGSTSDALSYEVYQGETKLTVTSTAIVNDQGEASDAPTKTHLTVTCTDTSDLYNLTLHVTNGGVTYIVKLPMKVATTNTTTD